MTEAPQILLAHHLKALKLPTFLREYEKQARPAADAARTESLRAFARGARPKGWITSSSWRAWSSWS